MVLTCCKSESQTSRRSSVSEAMPILSKWSPPIIPPLMEELNPFKSIVVVIILFFSILAYFSVFFSKHLLYEQNQQKIINSNKSRQITRELSAFSFVCMIQLAFSLQHWITLRHTQQVLVWTTTLLSTTQWSEFSNFVQKLWYFSFILNEWKMAQETKKYLISDIIVLSFVLICCWCRYLSYIQVFFWSSNSNLKLQCFLLANSIDQ